MAERMIVRSYRRVFRVDRRIYRVDRWALPVPGGVPLRGVGYFALALGLMVLLGRLPGAGEAVGVLSAPLRYVIVPLAIAVLACQAAPDGRVAHRFAADWLRLRLRGRRRSAGRRVPADGARVAFGGVLGDGVGRARSWPASRAGARARARDVQCAGGGRARPWRSARRPWPGRRRGG